MIKTTITILSLIVVFSLFVLFLYQHIVDFGDKEIDLEQTNHKTVVGTKKQQDVQQQDDISKNNLSNSVVENKKTPVIHTKEEHEQAIKNMQMDSEEHLCLIEEDVVESETNNNVSEETNNNVSEETNNNVSEETNNEEQNKEEKINEEQTNEIDTDTKNEIKNLIKHEMREEEKLMEILNVYGIVEEVVREMGGDDDYLVVRLKSTNNEQRTIEDMVLEMVSFYYQQDVSWEEVFDEEVKLTSDARYYLPMETTIWDDDGKAVFYQNLKD